MFKMGLAQKDITPPLGTPIAGNFREDYGCKGIYHRLYARALVIDDGSTKVGIVMTDLAAVTHEIVRSCRQKIKETTGIEPDRIMIAATHTHSGPDVGSLPLGQRLNDTTLNMIQSQIANAVIEAYRNSFPVKIGFKSGKEDTIGHNRRMRLKDGTVHMNWEKPDPCQIDKILGPIDPEVGVIKVEDMKGKLLAVFVNYTCHPAILAGDNEFISADYPGFLYERVKERLGKDILAIFSNGAQGNVNHIDPYNPHQKRGFEEAKRLGYKLADEAVRIVENTKTDNEIKVSCSSEKLVIPRRKISDERLSWAKDILSKWNGKPVTLVDGLPDEFYAREAFILKEKENQPLETELQVITIGDLALVGLPGEVFVEFGLEIKKKSPYKRTFIIGFANDSAGYVPTVTAFKEGGYEPTPARHSQLAENAGQLLVESACQQLLYLYKLSLVT